ncbi:MAG: redoxin family protein [Bacteroidales bacterium]|nr:redoxin family protein [Bacteroidales bacterium]
MRYLITLIIAFLPLVIYSQVNTKKAKEPVNADTVAMLINIIVSDPDNLAAHQKYIKYVGIDSPGLYTQYDEWMATYPKSVIVPYALGEALYNAEYPKAKSYLLKAVELDPKLAKAYLQLSIDAERWGEFEAAREYMNKACEADPASPDYAFYYASSFSDVDRELYRKLSLEVVARFPGTERGAQAIYWLALRTEDVEERIRLYKRLFAEFPPDKFGWSSSSMPSLFDIYLEESPAQAVEFALQMKSLSKSERDVKSWDEREKLAQSVIKVKSLTEEKRTKEAEEVAATMVIPRYSSTTEFINLLKAETSDAAGNTTGAYESLLKYFSAEPTDRVYTALLSYGSKMGKSELNVNDDVQTIRYATAVPATPFSLMNYMTNDSLTLADLKGKVVLLTYWFPGCGPCRGEFPNFENVYRKFKGKDVAYIGINIAHEQDEYVVPFVRSSGYSFIPLRDEPEKRGNLEARGAPTNYLLDKEGNIVFKNFRTDDRNERTLELMIQALIE